MKTARHNSSIILSKHAHHMRTDWHLLPKRVKSLEMKNIAKMLGSDKYDQLTSSHFLNIRPALKFKTKSAIYTETYIYPCM